MSKIKYTMKNGQYVKDEENISKDEKKFTYSEVIDFVNDFQKLKPHQKITVHGYSEGGGVRDLTTSEIFDKWIKDKHP